MLQERFLDEAARRVPALLHELAGILPAHAIDAKRSDALELLADWATKWGINRAWVIMHAEAALRWWRANLPSRALTPKRVHDAILSWQSSSGQHADQWPDFNIIARVEKEPRSAGLVEPFCPTLEYYPSRQTRASFLADVRAEAERYADEIERRFEARGYKPTPKKREERHFVWLVEYQLLRRSFTEIATSIKRNASTDEKKKNADLIQKAVKRLAATIDLELRPSRA